MQVWHRFAWTRSSLHRSSMPQFYRENRANAIKGGAPEIPSDHPMRARSKYPVKDDAFATLMMWLHSRIEATR